MSGKSVTCPVCGKYIFEEENDFDICDCCGWENDGVQCKDHNYAGGANELSVNEARIEYFLLNYLKTSEQVKKLRGEYLKKDRESRKTARRQYINKLNKLLNGIIKNGAAL